MRLRVEPAVHGALDYAELESLGLHPDDVLDFSVNSNAFGPSPLVRQAISDIPIDRYPDRESLALRRALAGRLRVPIDQILVGNGTAELIWLTAIAFLVAGEDVLLIGPTFGEYERAARLMDCTIHHLLARQENGFVFLASDIADKLDSSAFRLVFLCNPNNPTGQVLPRDILYAWAQKHPDTLFVVDEAYIAFVPGLESAISQKHRNILTLRSMTKDHSLAALRLGYAVADQEIIQALINVRPAWNVNAIAHAAGLATLLDEAHLGETLAQLQNEKPALIAGLHDLGYAPVPSATHYFLLPVDHGADFRRKLLARGILVRDCASFGLPEYVRIATRKPDENARLLQVIWETFHS